MRKNTKLPKVVNLKNEPYDIYIGRANGRYKLKRSDWHNPFHIGMDGTREEVIEKYRNYILGRANLLERLAELVGKRLGCWCKPEPCHGDVLVDLVRERVLSKDQKQLQNANSPNLSWIISNGSLTLRSRRFGDPWE